MAATFGHEPWFTCLPNFTKGYACARCRVRVRRVTLSSPEDNPSFHTETHAVRWPCASAVVLGLVERETSPKPTGAPETPSERPEAPEPRRSTPGASGGDGEGFNESGKPPDAGCSGGSPASEAENALHGGSPGLAASGGPGPASSP